MELSVVDLDNTGAGYDTTDHLRAPGRRWCPPKSSIAAHIVIYPR